MNKWKSFLRFVFAFLYVRDWHSGVYNLSLPRLTIFISVVVIMIVCAGLALWLQAPVYYQI